MDDKRVLRTGLCAARASRPAVDRAADGAQLASYAADLLALALPAATAPSPAPAGRDVALTVAAYAAVAEEPPTRPLLGALVALGARVLLPVVDDDALDWAPYDGWDALVEVGWGLLEPATARLGPSALTQADLVVVPALAVDRDGHRLGRGRGFYDRALGGVDRDRRVAVVYATELLAHVPNEPYDEDVGWALTPNGVVQLGG